MTNKKHNTKHKKMQQFNAKRNPKRNFLPQYTSIVAIFHQNKLEISRRAQSEPILRINNSTTRQHNPTSIDLGKVASADLMLSIFGSKSADESQFLTTLTLYTVVAGL